jgi:uncharacterized protein YjbI with pentapeptide repeats
MIYAESEHVRILKMGVGAWNKYMQRNGYNVKADFRGVRLGGFDLRKAVMNEADFCGADLTGANMTGGTFQRATFNDALLSDVVAIDAKFLNANFVNTTFSGADLGRAHFGGANMGRTNFTGADLRRVKMMFASISFAKMRRARLNNAHLAGCRFMNTDLTDATLVKADLTFAQLIASTLERADLTGCSVYGISVWDVKLDGARQSDLLITPSVYPAIRVDNVEVAQFIYLLLNNQKIRHVIDTITSKVVLILGRFTPERKVILDAIRDELRKRDYLPVLFDFEKPANKTTIETVSTLAHMARFVIADITDAKSVLQELQAVVPSNPSVPVQPVLINSQTEPGMFDFFRMYPWVLEPYLYDDQKHLLDSLSDKVIVPAEAKAKEQVRR